MRKKIFFAGIFAILILSLIVTLLVIKQWHRGTAQPYVKDELLIEFNPDVTEEEATMFLNKNNLTKLYKFTSINGYHVRLAKNMTVKKAIELIKNNPLIKSVSPNYFNEIY